MVGGTISNRKGVNVPDVVLPLAARRPDTVIVAIHSFTPRLQSRAPRPWHVGILYSHRDDRLSCPLIARLQAEPDLCIGDNEPYSGHLPGDAVDRHALSTGRHNTLIELRHDLIGRAEDQHAWACLLYTSPSPRDGLLSRMPSSA